MAELVWNMIRGAGTLMDLFGTSNSGPYLYTRSDAEAIRKDWEVVGKDLHITMVNAGVYGPPANQRVFDFHQPVGVDG